MFKIFNWLTVGELAGQALEKIQDDEIARFARRNTNFQSGDFYDEMGLAQLYSEGQVAIDYLIAQQEKLDHVSSG